MTLRGGARIWLRRDDFRGPIGFCLYLIAIGNVICVFYKTASFDAVMTSISLQLLSLIAASLVGMFTLAAPTLFNAAARITAIMILVAMSTIFVLHASQLKGSSPYEFDWRTLASLAAFSLALTVLGCWVLFALPVITLLILSATLFVVEFIARRLAEYQQGPIIGGSVLLAFIAGAYKAFH
jgi:hypothetical protein